MNQVFELIDSRVARSTADLGWSERRARWSLSSWMVPDVDLDMMTWGA
jgi:hypothetical protein